MNYQTSCSIPLRTTFGLPAKADALLELEPSDIEGGLSDELIQLLSSEDCFVLGGGSNVIFRRNPKGLVVHLLPSDDVECLPTGERVVWGGMELDEWVEKSLQQGGFGLENLSAIPGTVGGAVVQNAGAYGGEVGQWIRWVEAYDRQQRQIVRLETADCGFGYRTSRFKQEAGRWIVLRAAFALKHEFVPNLRYKALSSIPHSSAIELREGIVQLRWSKLPRPEEYGSAGSFFKNPVVSKQHARELKRRFPRIPIQEDGKLSAAWLIEQCGWKGRVVGGAGVWPQQPLVLFNAGDCTWDDLQALSEAIIADVVFQFNVHLVPEVVII